MPAFQFFAKLFLFRVVNNGSVHIQREQNSATEGTRKNNRPKRCVLVESVLHSGTAENRYRLRIGTLSARPRMRKTGFITPAHAVEPVLPLI